jgi:hypothetical protein
MRSTAMMARWLFVFGFATALVVSFGCSDGGSDGTTPPALACSDGGPAAADGVTMNCAGPIDSTTEQVDVVMGGPAAGATTLRGLNFDVTYDPTKLEFVPAAAYTSPLFSPDAQIAVLLLDDQPGHLVVGIQENGTIAAPVSVAAGQQAVVLSLSFRTAAGMTVAPTPLTFLNAEATDASATVAFSNGLMLSYQ